MKKKYKHYSLYFDNAESSTKTRPIDAFLKAPILAFGCCGETIHRRGGGVGAEEVGTRKKTYLGWGTTTQPHTIAGNLMLVSLVVVVLLLLNAHGQQLRSCWDGQLT